MCTGVHLLRNNMAEWKNMVEPQPGIGRLIALRGEGKGEGGRDPSCLVE